MNASAFDRRPRGALLLLVLGILTLFMLIGTVTLSLATRARTTSRAFATVTAGSAVGPLQARGHLEETLLQLLRGGSVARSAGLEESLLGDMYGTAPTLKGHLLSILDRGTLVEMSISVDAQAGSDSTPLQAADLCGKTVTFLPPANSSDRISTHRILRASGTGPFTCWISRLQTNPEALLPRPPCRIQVNPPAFREEAYDAYDVANPWLTRVTLTDGNVSSVPRPAFAASGTPAEVDNDYDGVKDGIWLNGILPSQPASNGGTIEFAASYLVLDLDGRINVNAHGSRTSIDLPASAWTNAPDVPTGSGYGPADVNASLVFVDAPANNQAPSDPPAASSRWRRVIGASGTAWPPVTAITSSTGQRRPAAQVGTVEGRYGASSAAGLAAAEPGGAGNDSLSRRAEQVFGNKASPDKTFTKTKTSGTTTKSGTFTWTDTWDLSAPAGSYELTLRYRAPGVEPQVTFTGSSAGLSQINDTSARFLPAAQEFTKLALGMVNLSGTSAYSFQISASVPSNSIPSNWQGCTFDTVELNKVHPLMDVKCLIKNDLTTSVRNSDLTVPKMAYYSPTWWRAGYVDDPYELRLDTNAPRPFSLRSGTNPSPKPVDNPFTFTDLEAVLRQFDVDAPTLSPRLAVALDGFSQRSRMLVTTDSWDTPGLTGPVANTIKSYVAGLTCDPAQIMSPDVLSGLRFDINRPFMPGASEAASKQEFCKHLFTLLVALGQPANAATAQWAANAVDYRDDDSTFTRFRFDSNPTDGWGEGTDGWSTENTVWGLERPELVIAQTIAFYTQKPDESILQDALYISLYRPSWTEELKDSTGAVVHTRKATAVDLSPKPAQSAQPVWRLRLGPRGTDESLTSVVRFDNPGNDREVPGVFRKTGGGQGDATIEPDTYLVVKPTEPSASDKRNGLVSVPVDPAFKKFEINSGGTFKAQHWPGAAQYESGADSIVFLERLENPDLRFDDDPSSPTYNPYVILDRLGIKRVNRTGENANNWKTYIRERFVWHNGPFETVGATVGIVPLNPTMKTWLPWADRAYVGQAELALVPQGGGAWRFWDYDIPKNKKLTKPYYYLPTPDLLEATVVPSRFSGSQVSVDPTTLAVVGMDTVPFNQLSRWREPGRVNLNTVLPNRNCAVPQHNDAVWWATLGPDAAVSLDEFQNAGPATSIRQLLSLMQTDSLYLDTAATAGVKGNSWKKNRPYELDPSAALATATRLTNVATIRSHVFAVWVTLRIRDTSAGGNDSFHRLFAIVDRSLPVGYTDGEDLDVRETIRVLRFLQ